MTKMNYETETAGNIRKRLSLYAELAKKSKEKKAKTSKKEEKE